MKTIHREILRLAWPAIAMNVTTPLLSLADVAIVGHVGGGSMIGAVAVGGAVFNVMYWVFAFLRMGTSGMTAQAYGRKDGSGQLQALARGIAVAAIGSIILMAVGFIAGKSLLGFVDGGSGDTELAWQYFSAAIIGAPGVLVTMVVSGWLLGMQRSRAIMWIALLTNLLNLAVSLLMVYVFHYGIRGVALGTAIAQLCGAVVGLLVVRKRTLRINVPGWFRELRQWGGWKRFFSINTDIFFRTLCLAAVTLWFTHAGGRISAGVLAGNAVLLQLFLVFSYFMDGFAFAGEALAGRFYGAGDHKSLRQCIRALFRWGICAGIIFSIVYFTCGQEFLKMLTSDMNVVSTATEYLLWAVLVPLTGYSAFTWDGIFIGLTRSRWLLASMAAAMVVFFGVYFAVMPLAHNPSAQNHVLWLAFVLYLGVRGLTSWWLYARKFH